jgi:hypothetical protein
MCRIACRRILFAGKPHWERWVIRAGGNHFGHCHVALERRVDAWMLPVVAMVVLPVKRGIEDTVMLCLDPRTDHATEFVFLFRSYGVC